MRYRCLLNLHNRLLLRSLFNNRFVELNILLGIHLWRLRKLGLFRLVLTVWTTITTVTVATVTATLSWLTLLLHRVSLLICAYQLCRLCGWLWFIFTFWFCLLWLGRFWLLHTILLAIISFSVLIRICWAVTTVITVAVATIFAVTLIITTFILSLFIFFCCFVFSRR